MAQRRTRARAPLRWTLWHPHQKLWNWRLEAVLQRGGRRVRLGGRLVAVLVWVDSVLLFASVLAHRLRVVGPLQMFRLLPPTTRAVLYVDCGVHKRGEQLRCVDEWFGDRCELVLLGFEASAEHAADAAEHLADLRGLDLRQLALVGPDAGVDHVKLYKGPRDGKADSLFTESDRFEVVPADRLSNVLTRDFGTLLATAPVLVRMNIEGSEQAVVEDLVKSGVADRIDGWFGMWDDVAKLDPDEDRKFRRRLADAHITKVTFNDRDLRVSLRRRAITLALDTAIRSGLQRKPAPPNPSSGPLLSR